MQRVHSLFTQVYGLSGRFIFIKDLESLGSLEVVIPGWGNSVSEVFVGALTPHFIYPLASVSPTGPHASDPQ